MQAFENCDLDNGNVSKFGRRVTLSLVCQLARGITTSFGALDFSLLPDLIASSNLRAINQQGDSFSSAKSRLDFGTVVTLVTAPPRGSKDANHTL